MIDVYPVGALSAARRAWRYLTLPAHRFPAAPNPPVTWRWRITRAAAEIRNVRRAVTRHVRDRDWHALKNTFNGYLAEPEPWPTGLTRCGTGWTRRRALRSLARRAAAQIVPDGSIRPNVFADINTTLERLRR